MPVQCRCAFRGSWGGGGGVLVCPVLSSFWELLGGGVFLGGGFLARACQYSVGALWGFLEGGWSGLVWVGLLLPFACLCLQRPTSARDDKSDENDSDVDDDDDVVVDDEEEDDDDDDSDTLDLQSLSSLCPWRGWGGGLGRGRFFARRLRRHVPFLAPPPPPKPSPVPPRVVSLRLFFFLTIN